MKPTYIFSFYGERAYRTRLSTGEETTVMLRCSYNYGYFSSVCELPNGQMFITGGREILSFSFDIEHTINQVLLIDTVRDFAIHNKQSMLTPRYDHGSAYCLGFVYVAGESPSERYVCSEDRWERITGLPDKLDAPTVVALEAYHSVYSIGGKKAQCPTSSIYRALVIQTEWVLMEVHLPFVATARVPCFKVDPLKVYLVGEGSLYTFDSRSIQLAREKIGNIWCTRGLCYYENEVLFCTSLTDTTVRQELGPLH
mmetsp:Transcript_24181/g.42975  ORF Transcript_24181/g.42975 Transcript_24181/m.42975 type:complete len:255 (+) Transcript_24181:280-1044(+)